MKSLILSFALGGLLFTAPQAFSEDKSYHRDRGDKVERHHQRGDKFERRHERTDRHQDVTLQKDTTTTTATAEIFDTTIATAGATTMASVATMTRETTTPVTTVATRQ